LEQKGQNLNTDSFLKYLGRAFLFLALGLMAIALLEIIANVFNLSLVAQRYGVGRLIELAGAFLTLVIVILLRQIRDGQRLK
jgi:hypothetical protein